MLLPSTLQSAKDWIQKALPSGGTAIDATVGNGHDTLFLAEQVGHHGHVMGFDIQKEAIASAHQRLHLAGQDEQVQLVTLGHHLMDQVLPSEWKEQIHVFMFNLGYLPHGNPEIITFSDTTLPALQIACEWLAPGGLITIALYTGHPGGQQESDAVIHWAKQLPPKKYQVLWQQIVNRTHAPSLLVIEKR
ncbi:class I SAM-dependent methyltransferase [Hazenella coriacea]|uniref:Putative rRNA methylase n=1 Tax=Hazenella coriacea TaxID=1179467 RepID=A0A4R3L9N5_9BACL|nr:class I SAM-dependent methyltransferase [Hazenella coriacea]TCS95938.1 putative rRNA methylase [Hazenella coriacea]